MNEEMLTVAEVAARLKCHPHTVRRWIWARKLHAIKVGDLVRVPEHEVARLLRPMPRRTTPKKRKPNRGAPALMRIMRRLRKKVRAADVKHMDRLIAEANQPADWSNPLG